MTSGLALEDRFEILKEIGDGSFGSVALARVRTAGSNVARRGSVIAIKTMKKEFESYTMCLELREVMFLTTLPNHIHLVPALDIFLDPFTKKLHIAMEYMDGNLYQLMKARDHKCLDVSCVKSILFQILQGLEHIHAHHFFHRDIKPENILVSISGHHDTGSSFRRYSTLMTPPSTPPLYTIKIADFGLAREVHSKLSYTTYVSTRWYRAPEVLLRAGEYSSPVDIWAIGAMAVEVATLKPLFPGANEVDQVWRICEIMGSPGNWYNKSGIRIGGGEWKDGTRLANKLGFSFPKMAPHSIDHILPSPQWPASFSNFVTWCLKWDPKGRPTSSQALAHEFFADAFDPLRVKSSTPKSLGRKQSDSGHRSSKDASETSHHASKSSWFRKSLIGRSESCSDPNQIATKEVQPVRGSPSHATEILIAKTRPLHAKRSTWNNGTIGIAPIAILPTIKPISPLSDTVTAQANNRSPSCCDNYSSSNRYSIVDNQTGKKIGRHLSIASGSNHYAEIHRQEAEMALNGNSGLVSPPSGQKESFFSHLRKRARRFSGRQSQIPITPKSMDFESHVGCGPWASNRSSMVVDGAQAASPIHKVDTYEALDRALRNVQQNLDASTNGMIPAPVNNNITTHNYVLKRHHSLPHQAKSADNLRGPGSISNRTRRSQIPHGTYQYETPAEEDELVDEKLKNTCPEMTEMRQNYVSNDHLPIRQSASNICLRNPYPTPSPSANGYSQLSPGLPSPCDKLSHFDSDENEWATAAAASILAASACF
ncbi:kinase-like protein [Erysiphe pulchra]|uniref:Kinase-like protein n=1 Tax=Erysiphe pulchra TaxID=225359 RepID=A0A2S4PLA6_9PEZI|nr:kinase-like protein [Erysiphe pulchra]